MKKFTSAAVSAVLACSLAAPAFAADFSDIYEDRYAWAVPYIEEMADLGLISGYTDGTYKPDKEVSRLEAICLFARAMGSNDAANADIVDFAKEQYAEDLAPYELNFGAPELSFMLYRGALKTSELDTYLADGKKDEAMPRHEAAVIITKAMGAESDAKKELMVDLAYTDAKEIPSKSTQYVYYVTEQGIMSGMDDGRFSPNTSVLRSQVAVMLSKTVDEMAIGFTVGKIVDIDTDAKNITLIEADDTSYEMGYTDDTQMIVVGRKTEAEDMPYDVNAVFTYAKGELLYVDVMSTQVVEDEEPDAEIEDEVVYGVFDDYASHDGVLILTVTPSGKKKVEEYECVEDIAVIRDGEKTTIRNFDTGDYVTLELSGGKVKRIIGEPKTAEIDEATIEKIEIGDTLTITISHADDEYDGMVLTVDSDVSVRKNNAKADMSDIYEGDTVHLTLEYGLVTAVAAQSQKTTVTGTIQELIISATPRMTVLSKDKEQTYVIPAGVEILINGEEKTLYDFRVGDSVNLTLEGQAIVKITATAVAVNNKSMTGTVTALHSSYGFIKVSYQVDGVTVEETVYCKDSTTTFIASDGEDLLMKDVKEGDIVTVRGSVKNGAYEAALIILETE